LKDRNETSMATIWLARERKMGDDARRRMGEKARRTGFVMDCDDMGTITGF
jgi:hypothetical protein